MLEKEKDYRPIITYEEDSDFESLKAANSKPKQEKKQGLFNKGNLKNEGTESGYHFTYVEIGIKDVIKYYSNEIKMETIMMLNQNTLPIKQL